jgi:hypothetical protein
MDGIIPVKIIGLMIALAVDVYHGNLWIFKNGVKGPGFMGFQASLFSIPGTQGILFSGKSV